MQPGTVIGERFEIERRAAAGGMGEVYQALDRTTGAPAALKVVRTASDDTTERLLREGRALAQLDHPHVVRYLGHGTTPEGEPFLAMEWIEGETLSRRIARQPLTIGETLTLVLHVADALGHSHAKGIVHRDVKPSNLILREGNLERVVLVDFGVARVRQNDAITMTGVIVGTPAYMSPEQARGARNIDPTSDVFALGCLVYRCLTGRNAFDADNPVAILAKIVLDDPPLLGGLVAGIDPDVERVVQSFLVKDPAKRVPNGSAAAEALRVLSERAHGDRRAPVGPERLTLTERRLVSLILAPTPLDPEATVVADQTDVGMTAVRTIARRHEAVCEVLANGMLVVAITNRGSATDQAALAARCALELRTALHGPPLVVVTGRAVVDSGQSSGTGVTPSGGGADVFDASTALVARLVAAGERECVIVDDTTAGLLDRNFVVVPHRLGLELRGTRVDSGDGGRLLGHITACVGREREIVTLEALLVECEAEQVSRVALVTALPGMGKSRLLREIVARVGSRAQVFHAVSDAMSSGSPYALLAQVVRGAAEIEAGDDAESSKQKLRARVARHLQRREVDRVADFLGEAAGVTGGDPSRPVLGARADPRLMTEQIRSAWLDWIGAECAAKALLIALDDVQWADVPSLRLVHEALSVLSDSALCVLAAGRPEAREVLPVAIIERAVPVPLGALSKKACEKLVRGALGEATEDVIASIVARAGGQALLLEELVRAHAEGHEDRSATAAVAIVQGRLETLDPESRRVLRAASVFGEIFWRSGVEHLLSISVGAQLDILESKEIVTRRATSRHAGEQELAFRHSVVKDAALAMLTSDDLALGHRLAGEWFEPKGNVDPSILAEHFARCDRPERAVPHLVRSASQALDSGDFLTALSRTARARSIGISGLAEGSLFLLEAEAYRWRGDTAEAEKAALRALDILDEGSAHWLDATRVALFSSALLGHAQALLSVAHRLAEVAPTDATRRAWLLAVNQSVSSITMAAPDPISALLLARADEHVTDQMLERDPVLAMQHFHARAASAFREGRYEQVLASAYNGMRHAAGAGDWRFGVFNMQNVGFALGQLGQYEASLERMLEAREEATRQGLAPAVMTIDQNVGYVLMSLGRLEEARDIEQALVDEAASGAPRLRTTAQACLARILLRLGDVEGAARVARAGVAGAPADVPKLYALASLAEAELAGGHAESAYEVATAALDLAGRLGGVQVGDLLAGRVLVEALIALGRVADARAALVHPLQLLHSRAQRIQDPLLRKSMLERVEDHRRLLELEVQLGDVGSS